MDSLFPSSGAAGLSHEVTVVGSGFFDSEGLGCRFGAAGSVPTAKCLSESKILCRTPVHNNPATVAVSVTLEGRLLSIGSGVFFEYTPEIRIVSVLPSKSNVYGGSAVVITTESRIENLAGDTVECRFGGSASVAVVLSDTSLRCTVPAGNIGIIGLSLGVKGNQMRVSSEVSFEYVNPSEVSSVIPSQGLLSGGTTATVTGDNFGSETSCRVGGDTCTGTVVVSSSLLLCVVPKGKTIGKVAVEVSSNGVDYEHSRVLFDFVSP